MEPAPGAAKAVKRRAVQVFALRIASACALLVGLSMSQSPGLVVADTKFDLVLDPGSFLARALHLWDPVGAFGQLQNQAYGYLWPMGPFFWLGSVADVPGWIIQRTWLALVLCVAFVGAALLSRALGIRSDLACLVAAFAYALSPRMLTTSGPISIEAWPSALAPWVLLPLVVGASRGSPRRAAAMSALAVAMVGGVNAAATFAVIPLGAMWLLTRTRGPRRHSMMIWWPLLTLLGTLWWLVPLFLLGSYSPPFLDYIESAAVTTFPTTIFDALRGTSNWIPYIDPGWRAGNDLIRQAILAVNVGVVLVLGFVGMTDRRNPHRLFLTTGTALGLVLVTMGHLGSVSGWGAEEIRTLLDGALAPLRNVHKFDLVVRLPLVLGLGWTVDAIQDARRRSASSATGWDGRLQRFTLTIVAATSAIAVLGAAMPVLAGRVTPADGFDAVPSYWHDAVQWLDDQDASTLMVPGSSFGQYIWGSPRDEPIQGLAESDWAVRNAVPLAPPGNIRMLDAVEDRFAQGLGSEGLAPYLRRAGITHLLVRNDLQRSADVPDPVLVHQALADSPGVTRVATFGPQVGGEAHLESDERGRVLINGGWQNSYPAVEVYRLSEPTAAAAVGDPGGSPVVVGGPEDLLDLTDLGIISDTPTRLAVDVDESKDPHSPVILTDGLRAVERNFGRVHDGASATLGGGQVRRLPAPTRDYLLRDPDRWSTWADVEGVADVSASSSRSDASTVGTVEPGEQPFSALDGAPETVWSSQQETEAPWLRVTFDHPQPVDTVTVTAGPDSDEDIRIVTDQVTTDPIHLEAGVPRTIPIDDPETSSVTIEDASGRTPAQLSLAEVAISDVYPRRVLRLPELPSAWGSPNAIVLRAHQDARTGCAEVDRAVRCVIGNEVAGEEEVGFRREFTLPESGTYDLSLKARPRAGAGLSALLQRELPLGISASTEGVPDARASALAAVDGDPGTAWVAGKADLRPELRLNWLGERTVRGLELSAPADTAVRLPEQVTVVWPEGQVTADVVKGRVRFPAIRTDELTVRVEEAEPAVSLDFDAVPSAVPVGIGELELDGVPYLPLHLSDIERTFDCGTGPTFVIDGVRQRTTLRASPAELYAGDEVDALPCSVFGEPTQEVTLGSGQHHIEAEPSAAFSPVSMVLTDPALGADNTHPVAMSRTSPVERTITPEDGDRVVAMRENTNPGWRATQNGASLDPVVVDGWQQGWSVEGSDPVSVVFGPDSGYRAGLAAGLLGLLALGLLVLRPPRRWVREEPAPVSTRVASVPVMGAVAVVVAGLLAGWVGAALGLGSVVLGLLLGKWQREAAPWIVSSALLMAAMAYAVRTWGGGTGWAGALSWPHYLVVVVLSVALTWAAEGEQSRR